MIKYYYEKIRVLETVITVNNAQLKWNQNVLSEENKMVWGSVNYKVITC